VTGNGEWADELAELARRRAMGTQLGGAERVARHHARGRLTARERIERCTDDGSFSEIGMLAGAGTYDEHGALREVSPAETITGLAEIAGTRVLVEAWDASVKRGAAESISREKIIYAERLAYEYRYPVIRLVDTAGATVVKHQVDGYADLPAREPQWNFFGLLGRVPVLSACLGPCAGLGAVFVCTSHFSVMAKHVGQVFAGGPPVVARATGEIIGKEELGGAAVHTRGSGVVDNAADDEDDAFRQLRAVLSYLPASVREVPARGPADDPPGRRDELLAGIIPRNPRTAYDVRRLIRHIVDRDSFFEIGRYNGGSQVTGLARLNGYAVGVLANDPKVYAGAMTVSSSEKFVRFVDMCDTFNIPMVNFVDVPGAAVGRQAEAAGTVRHVLRVAAATDQVSVPWFTVWIRRAFGLGASTHGPQRGANLRVAWPSANWGSIAMEGGVDAAFRQELENAEDPDAMRLEILAQLRRLQSPMRTAEHFGIEDVIDPRETRPRLCRWIEDAQRLLPDIAHERGRPMRP
jgi:acetyl-CoA carboxylase carboxyltransferase component